MSELNQYSDEHISAYIDGELDSDERARLLLDEQEDAVLAQRINDARVLKEKVQLAYADTAAMDTGRKQFSCTAFASRQKPLVAGLVVLIVTAILLFPAVFNNEEIILARQLIKNTVPIAPSSISKAIGANKKVVINISQYQEESFDDTIDHIEALLQQHRTDGSFSVEIVANKDGLRALDTETSAHAARISLLAERFDSLDVVACAKSLANLAADGNPIQLMTSIIITPSAAEQVARRTGEGWLYLKL